MASIGPRRQRVALVALIILVMLGQLSLASEFPERECCDPIYPPEPTSRVPTIPTPTGKSGADNTVAILNCLYARNVCFNDSSCRAILEMIPRVCGPELVACSTVTVSKCKAALMDLQKFGYFKPTCLCREPRIDRECNKFRDYIFDHPCISVHTSDVTIESLPTCNQASSLCQQSKNCTAVYNEYRANCKPKDGKCKKENREVCHESWMHLRLSPMFGCICPENVVKKKCDRIFSAVHNNHCIVNVISNADNSTSYELIESQVDNPLIDANHQDLYALKQIPIPNIHHHHHRLHSRAKNHTQDDHEGGLAAPSSLPENGRMHQQPVKFIVSSTCHHAYSACKSDSECLRLLQPVLSHCDSASCSKNECMNSLQHFYRTANHKHSIEIAFCLCKRVSKKDECMSAQEKMHPTCAQSVNSHEVPTCDALADSCRENKSCRSRLEKFEQNCAVDSVTGKCAGPPSACRIAMLGILGTELRTNCACKGTDVTVMHDCIGWQRLLWVNPCVVQSQKDFHSRRNKHNHQNSNNNKLTADLSSNNWATTAGIETWPSTPQASHVAFASSSATNNNNNNNNNNHDKLLDEEEDEEQREVENNVIPDATIGQTTDSTTVIQQIITTSTTTTTTSTTTTTTIAPTTQSTTTTSTLPPRFCVVQRARQGRQYIKEGTGKRLYKENEPDCSELCQCGLGEVLSCHTICIESSSCKTDFAVYNHAAPAYQAYRGRCLCYSGRFICMRPSPDAYNIPHGVFMFLGYSETDENLLKPHNNLTIIDAVSSLDSFMREQANNQTICALFLYNITKENVITVARLVTDNNQYINATETQSLEHLTKVKDECATMLQSLSEKINNHHQEVKTHPLLSIFKMAEVEIKLPRTSSATLSSSTPSFGLLCLIGLLIRLLAPCLTS